jgi:putative hydrolase of the HAD superfamily
MSIQAVIFDFGRVICDFDLGKFVGRATRASTLSADGVKGTMAESMRMADRYETGLMTSREFYLNVCRIASLTMSEQEFVSAWTDIFTPKQATFELVKRLKGRYRLGLLSNTNEWHYQFGIKPVGIFPLFDAVTLSFEVRAMKPDRRIYDDMLAKLALPAGTCVYIDDIAENVAAAGALGMHGIHYTTHEKLIEDLAKAGVEVLLH